MNVAERQLTEYIQAQIKKGASGKTIAKMVAAWLVKNRSSRSSDQIMRNLTAQRERDGYIEAVVQSARPLSVEQRQSIILTLQQHYSNGSILLHESIDASLRGGIIVSTPSMTFDASIAHKLRSLKTKVNQKVKG